MRWDWILMRKAFERAFLGGAPRSFSTEPRAIKLRRIRADRVTRGQDVASREAWQTSPPAVEEHRPAA